MMNSCCNRRNGFFEGYEAFWIIVVVAIVIIWVHYSTGCGFGSNNNACCPAPANNCCDPCAMNMNPCGCNPCGCNSCC